MIMQCLVCLATVMSIESAVMSVDKVVSVRTFETSDVVVVAALTQPVYSHKAIRDLKAEIESAVLQTKTGKRIIVTFDLDIYSKIKSQMTSEQKVKLIEILYSRQANGKM